MSSGAPLPVVSSGDEIAPARSLSGDAWYDLKRNPVFWIAGALALVMVLAALFPALFSRLDARTADCSLSDSLRAADAEHWFGFDKQGCDVYSRVVYGARSSVMVGVFSTLLAGLVALVIGMAAGFYGGWVTPELVGPFKGDPGTSGW